MTGRGRDIHIGIPIGIDFRDIDTGSRTHRHILTMTPLSQNTMIRLYDYIHIRLVMMLLDCIECIRPFHTVGEGIGEFHWLGCGGRGGGGWTAVDVAVGSGGGGGCLGVAGCGGGGCGGGVFVDGGGHYGGWSERCGCG